MSASGHVPAADELLRLTHWMEGERRQAGERQEEGGGRRREDDKGER